MRRFCLWLSGTVALSLWLGASQIAIAQQAVAADHGQKLDELLREGKLIDAQQHFRDIADSNKDDQVARMAQGLVEFLIAIENLGQSNHRFGLIQQHARNLPLARMPIPVNASPERVSYANLREVVEQFQSRLAGAEQTLAQVKTGEVQIPLYLGRVRLDLDGDGKFGDQETLWKIFAEINRGIDSDQGEGFYISVDGADVHWLRGYCHFLMAICDVALAYDERELFERCGQLLFPQIESPFQVAQGPPPEMERFETTGILDAIAAIHLIRFPLAEPKRMETAHAHLLAMIAQSRLCWEKANAEMDDDHEWIPNPNQTGVLEVRVSREVITGWHKVLDELEAILEGKKLIPYWRKYVTSIFGRPEFPETGTGINLKKFFLEPTDFDLVLSIQGSQIERYLEEGPLSTPQAWNELTQVFRGQFFGFAVWFN